MGVPDKPKLAWLCESGEDLIAGAAIILTVDAKGDVSARVLSEGNGFTVSGLASALVTRLGAANDQELG